MLKLNVTHKWIAVFILAGLMMTSAGGCSNPETPTAAGDLISKTITAMQNINSCSVSTNLTQIYHVVPNVDIIVTDEVWQWTGYRQTDIAQKQSSLSMDIRNVPQNGASAYVYEVIDIDGWKYYKQTEPAAHSLYNDFVPMTRTKTGELDKNGWLAKAGIAPQLALLNNLPFLNADNTEIINGRECNIIEAILTAETATNWILSSTEQYSGPTLGWFHTSGARSREIYIAAYKDGSVRMWIDKGNYHILKVNTNIVYDAMPGNVTKWDTGGMIQEGDDMNKVGFDHIIRTFTGIWEFSGYDMPVNIQLSD